MNFFICFAFITQLLYTAEMTSNGWDSMQAYMPTDLLKELDIKDKGQYLGVEESKPHTNNASLLPQHQHSHTFTQTSHQLHNKHLLAIIKILLSETGNL